MIAEIFAKAPFLEAGMLICFGISWPVDILKSIRVKRTEGKSLAFMVLVFVGYLSGLSAKFLRTGENDQMLEAVTWLYLLNAIFVAIDIFLFLRLRRTERLAVEMTE